MASVHQYQTRVRYAEIDRMGVAYHSRYIEWFEAARTEMLRDMGLPYKNLEEKNLFLPLVEVYCRYIKPVLYDELVTIHTIVKTVSRIKLHLEYDLFGEKDELLRAEGHTLHCFVNQEGKPVRADLRLVHFIQDGRWPCDADSSSE
jgi:acyl-CoA thioester hydrolase